MLEGLQLEDIIKKVINDVKNEKDMNTAAANIEISCGYGIFKDIGTAADRAYEAQQIYNRHNLEKRKEINWLK